MDLSSQAKGTATTAGVVCTCSPPTYIMRGCSILLDGKGIATASLNVSVEVLDSVNGTYVAPTTLWGPNSAGVTNPVVLALGTAQMVNILGSWSGVRVNIPSFGTSTGTFNAVIQTY